MRLPATLAFFHRRFRRAIPSLAAAALLALAPHRAAADAALAFQSKVEPLLKNYCTDCHGPKKQKGKVDLTARTLPELTAKPEMWFRALEQVESGDMPSDDEKKQPTAAERAQFAAWIRGEYTQALIAQQRSEGRSKLRRLTRKEYANTLEDIFGVRPAVEKFFPSDGLIADFDKVGSALPLSAEGAMGYLRMADELQKWALKPLPKVPESGDRMASRTVRGMAAESGESKGHLLVLDDGWGVSFNTDTSSGRTRFGGARVSGLHRVRLHAYAYQTDKPLPVGIYKGRTNASSSGTSPTSRA